MGMRLCISVSKASSACILEPVVIDIGTVGHWGHMPSDAFTHGPTGPGPRGPLKILKLGGPEQNIEKPMNFAMRSCLR